MLPSTSGSLRRFSSQPALQDLLSGGGIGPASRASTAGIGGPAVVPTRVFSPIPGGPSSSPTLSVPGLSPHRSWLAGVVKHRDDLHLLLAALLFMAFVVVTDSEKLASFKKQMLSALLHHAGWGKQAIQAQMQRMLRVPLVSSSTTSASAAFSSMASPVTPSSALAAASRRHALTHTLHPNAGMIFQFDSMCLDLIGRDLLPALREPLPGQQTEVALQQMQEQVDQEEAQSQQEEEKGDERKAAAASAAEDEEMKHADESEEADEEAEAEEEEKAEASATAARIRKGAPPVKRPPRRVRKVQAAQAKGKAQAKKAAAAGGSGSAGKTKGKRRTRRMDLEHPAEEEEEDEHAPHHAASTAGGGGRRLRSAGIAEEEEEPSPSRTSSRSRSRHNSPAAAAGSNSHSPSVAPKALSARLPVHALQLESMPRPQAVVRATGAVGSTVPAGANVTVAPPGVSSFAPVSSSTRSHSTPQSSPTATTTTPMLSSPTSSSPRLSQLMSWMSDTGRSVFSSFGWQAPASAATRSASAAAALPLHPLGSPVERSNSPSDVVPPPSKRPRRGRSTDSAGSSADSSASPAAASGRSPRQAQAQALATTASFSLHSPPKHPPTVARAASQRTRSTRGTSSAAASAPGAGLPPLPPISAPAVDARTLRGGVPPRGQKRPLAQTSSSDDDAAMPPPAPRRSTRKH